MASFSGFIKLQDGSDELFWNEIDVEGVVEDCHQFLWESEILAYQIFYTNPPTIPVDPPVVVPPIGGGVPANPVVFSSYNGTRVFQSYNPRKFSS